MTSQNTLMKLWGLLRPKQRHAIFPLLGLMLVGMILEMMGIGFVIPAVAVMTQPDIAQSYPVLGPFLVAIGSPTQSQLVIGGMLVLIGLYAIKTMFLTFLIWKQYKFVFTVHADLSDRLFTGYMLQPWPFHLQRNSAQLLRNVTSEIHTFTHSALLPGMVLATELLVLLGTSMLLW